MKGPYGDIIENLMIYVGIVRVRSIVECILKFEIAPKLIEVSGICDGGLI
jgi:hypothetical protein